MMQRKRAKSLVGIKSKKKGSVFFVCQIGPVLFLNLILTLFWLSPSFAATQPERALIYKALQENLSWQESKLTNAYQADATLHASDTFLPRFFIQSNYVDEHEQFLNNRYHSHRWDIGPKMHWRFPLGTKLEVRLQHESGTQKPKQHYAIYVKQPLLKGAGQVNTLSLSTQKIEKEIADIDLNLNAMKLVAAVCRQYFKIQLAMQSLQLAKSNLERAEELNTQIEQKILLGRLPEMDRQLMRSSLKQKEAHFLESEQQLKKAQFAMSYLLGGAEFELPLYTQLERDQSVSFPIALEIEQWLPYQRFLKKIQISKLQEVALKDKSKMDVNVFVGANSNRLSNQPNWPYRHTYQMGVELSKPLMSSPEDKQQLKAYTLTMHRLKLGKRELELQFEQEKSLLESQFNSLTLQKKLTQEAERLSKQNLEAAQLKLEAGRISLQEWVLLQYQQDRLMIDRQKLDMDFYELELELDMMLNRLLDRYDIRLTMD